MYFSDLIKRFFVFLVKKIQENMKNNPTNENFEKKKIEKIPKTFENKFFSLFLFIIRWIMMKKYFIKYLKFIF